MEKLTFKLAMVHGMTLFWQSHLQSDLLFPLLDELVFGSHPGDLGEVPVLIFHGIVNDFEFRVPMTIVFRLSIIG